MLRSEGYWSGWREVMTKKDEVKPQGEEIVEWFDSSFKPAVKIYHMAVSKRVLKGEIRELS